MKTQPSKKGKRPFGINAIIALLALLVLNNGVDVIRTLSSLPPHTFPEVDALIIQMLNAVIAIFYAVLAVGLWQMRDWAWYAAMIGSGLSMFFAIWRHFNGGQPYVTMFLVVVMVFYLNQREVKASKRSGRGWKTRFKSGARRCAIWRSTSKRCAKRAT